MSRPDAAARPVAAVPLIELLPVHDGKDGRFDGRSSTRQRLEVVFATRDNPFPHRRPLAAYRLARSLGLTAVPHTTTQRLPLSTVAALLEAQPDARRAIEQRLVIGNDGATQALLQHPCVGRRVHVGTGPLFDRWAELAASTRPLDAAARRSVRGYVEMAVLDYLVGNVERRTVMFDERSGRLCLDENDGAFSGYLSPDAHDMLLTRLRPIVRFPRGLAEALQQLDRQAARRLLQRGGFAHWLVAPRELVGLAERRATLATLLHALAQRYGADIVFSLDP